MSNIDIAKIVLDPGHGGIDSGAVANGIEEEDCVLEIAKYCRAKLESYGATVYMTRTDDYSLEGREDYDSFKEYKIADLNARVNFSNNKNSNIFVSIHNNAGGGTGVETYVNSNSSSFEEKLATRVNNYLASSLSARNRGVKTEDYIVIKPDNEAWSILTEVLYVDNSSDAEKLKSDTYLKKAGENIAYAIRDFLENDIPPIE